jgi:hypothetical protein
MDRPLRSLYIEDCGGGKETDGNLLPSGLRVVVVKDTLTFSSVEYFLSALSSPSCKIVELVLDSIYVDSTLMQKLVCTLSLNRSITTVSLANCGIDGTCASHISSLSCSSGVKTINFKGNYLGDEGIAAVSNLLKKNKNIIYIDFEDNGIGDPGIESLVATILAPDLSMQGSYSNSHIFHLQVLGFGCNKITHSGLDSLLKLCTLNCNITSLDVSGNLYIGDSSISMLSNFVLENKSLRHIDISNTSVSAKGLDALFVPLKENDALVNICVSHKGFTPSTNPITELGADFYSVQKCYISSL